MQAQQNEAGVAKQKLVGLVDGAVILFLFWQYSKFLAAQSPYAIPDYPIHPIFLIVVGLVLYRFICLVLFNQTLGMKLLKVECLNGEEGTLSFSEKLLAACFILYQGAEYYEKPGKIY